VGVVVLVALDALLLRRWVMVLVPLRHDGRGGQGTKGKNGEGDAVATERPGHDDLLDL
jgi:hypothetical protein